MRMGFIISDGQKKLSAFIFDLFFSSSDNEVAHFHKVILEQTDGLDKPAYFFLGPISALSNL